MMDHYDINEKVEALSYTQKAFDILDGLVTKTPQINEMRDHLKEVRRELAYEIFRGKP